jgi:hypothetical protein
MNYNINELIYNYLLFDDKLKYAEYLNDTYSMKKIYENKYNGYALINPDLLFKKDAHIIYKHCERCNIIIDFTHSQTCEYPFSYGISRKYNIEHENMCKECTKIYGTKYKCEYCESDTIILNCKNVTCGEPHRCCDTVMCWACLCGEGTPCKCCNKINKL